MLDAPVAAILACTRQANKCMCTSIDLSANCYIASSAAGNMHTYACADCGQSSYAAHSLLVNSSSSSITVQHRLKVSVVTMGQLDIGLPAGRWR